MKSCQGVWLLLLGSLLPWQRAAAESAEGARAAAASIAVAQEMTLHLELVLNGAPTGRLLPVLARPSSMEIWPADLASAGVRIEAPHDQPLQLERVVGISFEYDEPGQRLLLNVPPEWLDRTIVDLSAGRTRIEAKSDRGFLLTYDLHLSEEEPGPTRAAVWNEFRWFGPEGIVRSAGVQTFESSSRGGGTKYIRYDTSWTQVDPKRILTYEAGDLITRTSSWSAPVRLAGVQVSRDFSIRPDLVTYPVPEFTGTAAVPTTLDLFVAGHKVASEQLKPGPFTLDTLPYVNGAGEAIMVTTDALGRRTATAIPFYVAPTLLRPGLSDFALSAGFLRQDYGRKSFSYGPIAASAGYRRGITDALTLEAQVEASPKLAAAGAGGAFKLGTLGILNGSFSLSRRRGRSGSRTTVGYEYSGPGFDIGIQHERTSADFDVLADLERQVAGSRSRQTRVFASTTLRPVGSISLSYVDADYGGHRSRLLGATWSRSVFASASLMLNASRDMQSGKMSGFLQLLVPFAGSGMAMAGLRGESDRPVQAAAQLSRSIPSNGGWGGTLAAAGRESIDRYQAEVRWRGPAIELGAGAYGTSGTRVLWGEAAGSVVLMDRKVFAARKIRDGFAVVSTTGLPNVSVTYENQRIGRTDRDGYLIVPSVPAYYGAKYGIDIVDLPADVEVPVVEQRAAVLLGSGRLIRFPLKKVQHVALRILDSSGSPLAAGSRLTSQEESTVVGLDGFAFVKASEGSLRLEALTPEGRACVIELAGHQEAAAPVAVTCR